MWCLFCCYGAPGEWLKGKRVQEHIWPFQTLHSLMPAIWTPEKSSSRPLPPPVHRLNQSCHLHQSLCLSPAGPPAPVQKILCALPVRVSKCQPDRGLIQKSQAWNIHVATENRGLAAHERRQVRSGRLNAAIVMSRSESEGWSFL